jgi:hypothetical protein
MAAWPEDRWLQDNIEFCKNKWWKFKSEKEVRKGPNLKKHSSLIIVAITNFIAQDPGAMEFHFFSLSLHFYFFCVYAISKKESTVGKSRLEGTKNFFFTLSNYFKLSFLLPTVSRPGWTCKLLRKWSVVNTVPACYIKNW